MTIALFALPLLIENPALGPIVIDGIINQSRDQPDSEAWESAYRWTVQPNPELEDGVSRGHMSAGDPPESAEDLSFTVFIGFDSENLYVGVSVSDLENINDDAAEGSYNEGNTCHPNMFFAEEMILAGAKGYVLKSNAMEELVTAIQTVLKGETYVSPSILDMERDSVSSFEPFSDRFLFKTLTAREREVLQLIAEGKSTKEIAMLNHITTKTVEKHRGLIKKKLNIQTTAEAVKFALRMGLTSL